MSRMSEDTVTRRARDDKGAILIFLALSMAVLMVIAALVLDGGSAYVQRRQMQNAADASSMAGARALSRYRFPTTGSTPDLTAIVNDVNTTATNNGATTVVSCRLFNYDQIGSSSDLGPCTSATAANNAEGVRVTVSQTRSTYFGGITGRPTTTANVTASAAILELTSVSAPFIVCHTKTSGNSVVYDLLNSDGTINPAGAAAAGEITIHGSQVPDCGAGSQFKGLTDNPKLKLNVWSDIGTQGNRVGQYRDVTTGINACPVDGPFNDCDMLLPIMQSGNGTGSNATAFITAFAVFHVTEGSTGNEAHTAHYVATITQAGAGEGAGVDFGAGDGAIVKIIKLVE